MYISSARQPTHLRTRHTNRLNRGTVGIYVTFHDRSSSNNGTDVIMKRCIRYYMNRPTDSLAGSASPPLLFAPPIAYHTLSLLAVTCTYTAIYRSPCRADRQSAPPPPGELFMSANSVLLVAETPLLTRFAADFLRPCRGLVDVGCLQDVQMLWICCTSCTGP